VVNSLAQTWEETTHLIRTKYGISDEGYSNDKLNLLFGPGQGATLGPFLWLLCFIIFQEGLSVLPIIANRTGPEMGKVAI